MIQLHLFFSLSKSHKTDSGYLISLISTFKIPTSFVRSNNDDKFVVLIPSHKFGEKTTLFGLSDGWQQVSTQTAVETRSTSSSWLSSVDLLFLILLLLFTDSLRWLLYPFALLLQKFCVEFGTKFYLATAQVTLSMAQPVRVRRCNASVFHWDVVFLNEGYIKWATTHDLLKSQPGICVQFNFTGGLTACPCLCVSSSSTLLSRTLSPRKELILNLKTAAFFPPQSLRRHKHVLNPTFPSLSDSVCLSAALE